MFNSYAFLIIVLTVENSIYVLDEDPSFIPKDDTSKKEKDDYVWWREHNSKAMISLKSLENRLQKQHKNLESANEMMINLKEMFRQYDHSLRQHAMK